jgi:hypothetical protein
MLGLPIAALIASWPVALDGESVSGDNTAIAVISVVSIVFGYLLLAGLWYFVFREKARAKRGRDSSD